MAMQSNSGSNRRTKPARSDALEAPGLAPVTGQFATCEGRPQEVRLGFPDAVDRQPVVDRHGRAELDVGSANFGDGSEQLTVACVHFLTSLNHNDTSRSNWYQLREQVLASVKLRLRVSSRLCEG